MDGIVGNSEENLANNFFFCDSKKNIRLCISRCWREETWKSYESEIAKKYIIK